MNNAKAENPRAVAGDNEAPDYARDVTYWMAREYAEIANTVAALETEALALPETVDDDEMMGAFARVIVRMRDVVARLNAFRVKEKEPYLRGGEAVDTFCFALMDRLARRDRKAQPALADVLQQRLDDFNQRKLAAEQARLNREREAAERAARVALQRAEDEERKAAEARASAERARKPEIAEAKADAATQQETRADEAKVEHTVAADRAQDAKMATYVKPADVVRTRIESGGMVTMGTESYAVVTNSALLDKDKLWPFISEAEKEKALRGFAKNTGHTVPMAGADIGKRPKSIVRR